MIRRWQPLRLFHPLVLAIAGTFVALVPLESSQAGDPAEGYRLLVEKPYLPPDFDQETFDNIYRVWPQSLRERAEQATEAERRQMAFERYGLSPRADADPKPLQYVVDDEGNWTLNCFACHGGTLLDQTYPGLPNRDLELETLTEDIRLTKMLMGRAFSGMDLGLLVMPLGTTRGTTNAVNFGIVLMAYRDADLNVHRDRPRPAMVHHDLDAPPWWHFRKKRQIYFDGYAQKNVRGLMQMTMVPQNGPESFRRWVSDYEHIYAFLESLEPPVYPFAIDTGLAQQGKVIFEQHCARCHGTYGDEEQYPQVTVPLAEIGTDPVRLRELKPHHRDSYGSSWFAKYGQETTVNDPAGYVAPPLDGIWATAPYLHNGSVPTLWHLLRPDERPSIWQRIDPYGYNEAEVGLRFVSLDAYPSGVLTSHQRRQIFDTSKLGKSAAGHDFPAELDSHEKRAVLEYLKTL